MGEYVYENQNVRKQIKNNFKNKYYETKCNTYNNRDYH